MLAGGHYTAILPVVRLVRACAALVAPASTRSSFTYALAASRTGIAGARAVERF